MPIALLGYLLFLFVPMLGRLFPDVETFTVPFHLGATLASIAVFLPLYFHVFRRGARWKLPAVLPSSPWAACCCRGTPTRTPM